MNKKQKETVFKALGHETRFDIFENIFQGGYACSIDQCKKDDDILSQATCVTTIAQTFDSKLPTISRHLKTLKDANIINMTKKGSKIYIEPNVDVAKQLAKYFTDIVENYSESTLQFDNTN